MTTQIYCNYTVIQSIWTQITPRSVLNLGSTASQRGGSVGLGLEFVLQVPRHVPSVPLDVRGNFPVVGFDGD
jgi:hypothetical protein